MKDEPPIVFGSLLVLIFWDNDIVVHVYRGTRYNGTIPITGPYKNPPLFLLFKPYYLCLDLSGPGKARTWIQREISSSSRLDEENDQTLKVRSKKG